MTTIKESIRRLLGLTRRSSARLSPKAASMIARDLESTQDVEYDCDQVYRLLDQFAEAVQRGESEASWVPLIRAHLERCTDCSQEFEALLRVLEATWS